MTPYQPLRWKFFLGEVAVITISHDFVIRSLTCINLPTPWKYKPSPNTQWSKHPRSKHVAWQSSISCQSPLCPNQTIACILLAPLPGGTQNLETAKTIFSGNGRKRAVASLLLGRLPSTEIAQSLPIWFDKSFEFRMLSERKAVSKQVKHLALDLHPDLNTVHSISFNRQTQFRWRSSFGDTSLI